MAYGFSLIGIGSFIEARGKKFGVAGASWNSAMKGWSEGWWTALCYLKSTAAVLVGLAGSEFEALPALYWTSDLLLRFPLHGVVGYDDSGGRTVRFLNVCWTTDFWTGWWRRRTGFMQGREKTCAQGKKDKAEAIKLWKTWKVFDNSSILV